MAVSSFAAKAGTAGAVTVGGGGVVGTYLAWDHITLYEVERGIINKDVKLKAEAHNSNKSIKISIDESSNGLVKSGSWECLITSKEDKELTDYSKLVKHVQSHLHTSGQELTDTQKENKKLLVKACAKNHKKEGETNPVIKGSLVLNPNSESFSKFTFEDHSYLDFLLDNVLFDVEEEVAGGKVALTVGDITGSTNKTVKVDTKGSDWSDSDTNKKYWECTISLPTGSALTKQKLQGELSTTETNSKEKNLKNINILVRKCSDSRDDGTAPTNKRVKSKLDLVNSGKTTENDLIAAIFG